MTYDCQTSVIGAFERLRNSSTFGLELSTPVNQARNNSKRGGDGHWPKQTAVWSETKRERRQDVAYLSDPVKPVKKWRQYSNGRIA